MKRAAILLAVLFLASLSTTGCVVRTGRSGHALSGPSDHRHQHCHDRGGKHHKKVCHSHPHQPDHH